MRLPETSGTEVDHLFSQPRDAKSSFKAVEVDDSTERPMALAKAGRGLRLPNGKEIYMLVLSRGPTDKIIFPNLDITVEILRIKGNKVRLGIDAPKDIHVLRHELVDEQSGTGAATRTSHWSHAFRNRLNTANLALHVLQRQLEAGLEEEAEETLKKALRELDTLNETIGETTVVQSSTAPARPPCRALLVEDDANESELLAGYLRMSGFEVDRAMDGLQAMVYLSRHRSPDVVLLDMKMPRLDGPKTVASIRQDAAYRDVKIFAVSGTPQSECGVSTGPQGVDRWFSKPINPQKLVDEMNHDLATAQVSA
jgi:carbon storage regulator CsrA